MIKLILRIMVSFSLLLWVFCRTDLGQMAQLTKTADLYYLAAMWGMVLAAFWLRSVKMRIILRTQGCYLTLYRILAASAITFLYSMILPGMLNTGIKWYILKKHTGKGVHILNSMVYNQFTEFFISLTLGLAAWILVKPDVPTKIFSLCGIFLAAFLILCILLLDKNIGKKAVIFSTIILKYFPEKFRDNGQKILLQMSGFRWGNWRFHLKIALFNLIQTAAGIFIFIFAACSAGIQVPVEVIIWSWAMVSILGKLPVSLANLGVREVTLAGTLAVCSVEPPQALLMSMIIFSATLLMVVIGLVWQITWLLKSKTTTKKNA